jgi:hypothetical protein
MKSLRLTILWRRLLIRMSRFGIRATQMIAARENAIAQNKAVAVYLWEMARMIKNNPALKACIID